MVANLTNCGSRDWPLGPDRTWDASATKARLFAWAGFDGDSPDTGKAKKVFLLYDADAPENKGSWFLPFCDVDGDVKAMPAGVRAAKSAAPKVSGASDDQVAAAQAVCDSYLSKMADDGEKSSPVFAYQTPVVVRAKGGGNDDLMALAKARALDPDALDEFPPFFFSVDPSTNALDSYFTQMAASSLKNYAADFAEGRAFQNSHRHDETPIGYSLTGRYVGGQGDGRQRATADFFTARGIGGESLSTDALIAKLRTGLIRDVSIGFHGGEWVCSICGRDMLTDWDCWHIPGMSYDPNAKDMDWFYAQQTSRAKSPKADKEPIEKVLCTATIEHAHAAECSGVFDGATPGAVVKAQRMADAGRLPPQAARLVEARYRVRIAGADQAWNGWTPPENTRSPKEESRMDFEQQVREVLGLGADADALAAVRALKERADAGETALKAVRATVKALGAPDDADSALWARDEVTRLRPLADDGARYRADLIDGALAEGVRALGNGFATETYRAAIAALPIEAIKRFRDDWKAQGDKVFPGGRETTDETGAPIPLNPRRSSKRALAGV